MFPRGIAVPLAVLLSVHLGLLLVFDLAARLEATLALLAMGFAALVALGRRGERQPLRPAHLLLVAAVLRVLLLPLPPTLSNDILRYLWDGRLVASGQNPYALAPEAPALEPLRDELWESLDHRDVPTVYPPLAMALFTGAAVLPLPAAGQVVALKAALAAADLLVCWLIAYLARRRGIPEGRAVWYAWNPLVVLEVAGMGHVDALGVAAVVATVALLARGPGRGKVVAAAAAATAGVLAKLAPLALVPSWSRHSGRPFHFTAVVAALLAVTCLPLVASLGGVPPGLVRYGVSWEFNGPLFEPLWRLFDLAGTTALVESGLDALKEATGHHEAWNRLYPFNYPQLHAKLLLGAAMAILVGLSLRWRDSLRSTGALLGGLLLCSATVYPWYLLWVLPFAALLRQPAWLALAALAPLSYLPQLRDVGLHPQIFLAIWLPFLALLLADLRRARRSRAEGPEAEEPEPGDPEP